MNEKPVAAPDPQRTRPGGFTIFELIAVLALVAIVLGIALPRIDVADARVRSSSIEVVTLLTSAQSRAVMNQHDVVVRFDTVAHDALVHLDGDNDGAIDAGESTVLVALGEGVRFGHGEAPALPAGGEAVSFTQTRGGLPSLTFHRNGSASQTGLLYLVAGSVTGRASVDPEHVRAIEVARPTGRAVCYRYRASGWETSC